MQTETLFEVAPVEMPVTVSGFMKGRLTSWDAVRKFIFAGKAYFTIRSANTGVRFTFRVRVNKSNPTIHFVSLLRGPDNGNDYAYVGIVIGQKEFKLTAKSKVTADVKSVVAFRWMFNAMVSDGSMHSALEIWHEGRCGRCGRMLTVPESVSSGYGAECLSLMGG